MSDLANRSCKPCEGGVAPLDAEAATEQLGQLAEGWSLDDDRQWLSREFSFDNYYQTTAFINAVAWIAHGQDHHPDISFGYNSATVRFTTHAIGGLSDNDFICAARIDQLFA